MFRPPINSLCGSMMAVQSCLPSFFRAGPDEAQLQQGFIHMSSLHSMTTGRDGGTATLKPERTSGIDQSDGPGRRVRYTNNSCECEQGKEKSGACRVLGLGQGQVGGSRIGLWVVVSSKSATGQMGSGFCTFRRVSPLCSGSRLSPSRTGPRLRQSPFSSQI